MWTPLINETAELTQGAPFYLIQYSEEDWQYPDDGVAHLYLDPDGGRAV